MGVFGYSGRDELLPERPGGSSDPGELFDVTLAPGTDGPWPAPLAEGPLAARLSLPGSKSLTNRELVLAALADGPSTIRRPLHSRDTTLMIEGLRSLRVGIERVPGDGSFAPDPPAPRGVRLRGPTDPGLAR